LAAFGPKAVHSPKPVKANSTASIVTATETAGSGADDKVCINFSEFVNNLCINSYTITKYIRFREIIMGQKTALGNLLKAIGNSGQGKVVPGWGAVPIMTVIGLLLLVFLVSLLQIYNQSLLLQGFSVDWNGN
jgi:photosystem II PsbH protein